MSDSAASAIHRPLPGRETPPGYAYDPAVFRRAPDLEAETLYVVGGLHGNRHALDAVEAMMMQEARHRAVPRIVFNGDFHWLDVDPPTFNEIDRRVMHHVALRGNVETELAALSGKHGCGGGFPDCIEDAVVERSNRIIERLRATAMRNPVQRGALGMLPMHAVARVGEARVGIVHGDAESLAGWGFSSTALRDPASHAALAMLFAVAGVDVFASSHTSLPAFHRLTGAECKGMVVNNGLAGMPNFRATRHGVATRIAVTPAPEELPVLHQEMVSVDGGSVYVAAVAVCYDNADWRRHFLWNWPPGSAAHQAYWLRIVSGPNYDYGQAYRS